MLELPFSYGSLKLKWKSGSPNHHWSVFPSLGFDLFILFSLWADLARFIFGMCKKKYCISTIIMVNYNQSKY